MRFEEDYFSSEKPYSLGLLADYFELKSSPVGQEVWQFPDFLQCIFNTKPAATVFSGSPSGRGGSGAEPRLGDMIFKDGSMTKMRVYVNSGSEIFIPTSLYEESKHLPM